MATKGERAKVEQERAASAKHPKRLPHASAAKWAAARGRRGADGPGPHNEARRAGRNSAYELEVSATKRPSRKSTRKSATRSKRDGSLRVTRVTRVASAQARASRSSGSS
jgi:hypothetical protein